MQEYKEFKVSDVDLHAGLDQLRHGFAITDLRGSPLLSITYRTHDEAIAAREAIVAALVKAIVVYA